MSNEIIHVYTKLQEACYRYEAIGCEVVASWFTGDEIMLRVTKMRGLYTLTCAFMVNGVAVCSADVQDGIADEVFRKLQRRLG